LLFIGVILQLGCTNNISLRGKIAGNSVQVPTTNSDNSGTFTLSRVVKNSLDPNGVLDLIGDGSGSFGSLCPSTGSGDAAASATSPTVCECSLSYQTSGDSQQIFTPVIYHETNLLRCSYANLPSDTTSVDVSIHITTADTYSSIVKFNFSGTGVILDASNPDSFSNVIRYQCRDSVVVPYLFDGSIYDPILSEDPHLSYPLNFYAVNLGGTISTYANSVSQNPDVIYWNCPSILNPFAYLTTAAQTTFFENNHLNMTIYSKAFLNGSKLIYPPSGGFDRSNFYLAKQKSGIFSVPVNAYIAPGVVTQEGTDHSPIGYGASPVSSGASGQETCPDTTATIPTGYHWVKVWLFRAHLLPRKYASYGQQQSGGTGNTSGQTGLTSDISLICNPGNWAMDSAAITWQSIYAACPLSRTASKGGAGNPAGPRSLSYLASSDDFEDLDDDHYLADRILGVGQTSMCVIMNANAGNYCASAGGTNYRPGPGCDSEGFDFWSASATPNIDGLACKSNVDPFHVCSSAGTEIGTIPYVTSDNFSLKNLDDDSGRYDYIFVVTPPTVTVNDMTDTAASTSSSLAYQPFRFKSNTDCLSTDPDNPISTGDCSLDNKIDYGLKLHDVSNSEDPGAEDPKRAGVFPVCALQKDL
jgi:hypothetical protein